MLKTDEYWKMPNRWILNVEKQMNIKYWETDEYKMLRIRLILKVVKQMNIECWETDIGCACKLGQQAEAAELIDSVEKQMNIEKQINIERGAKRLVLTKRWRDGEQRETVGNICSNLYLQWTCQTLVRGRRARVGGLDPGGRTLLGNRGVRGRGRSWAVETACSQDRGPVESILRERAAAMRSWSLLHWERPRHQDESPAIKVSKSSFSSKYCVKKKFHLFLLPAFILCFTGGGGVPLGRVALTYPVTASEEIISISFISQIWTVELSSWMPFCLLQNSWHISQFFGVSAIASLSRGFSPLPAIPRVSHHFPVLPVVLSKAWPFLGVVVDQVAS